MQGITCLFMALLPWVSTDDRELLQCNSHALGAEPFVWTGFALAAAAMLSYGAIKPSVYWRLRGLALSSLFWASAAFVYQSADPGSLPVLFFAGSFCAVFIALIYEVRHKPRICGQC